MPSVDLIIFAIQAGIRLSSEVRQAYIDNTKQRDITLTLPDVVLDVTQAAAYNYFCYGGSEYVNEGEDQLLDKKLVKLHKKIENGGTLSGEDEVYYIKRYRDYKILNKINENSNDVNLGDGLELDPETFNILFTLENYGKDEEGKPKPIHRIAGTLIELGIDYFVHVPGTLNGNSKEAKLLRGFLEALDDTKFSEILLEDEPLENLVRILFVAAFETIADQPETITGDPNFQSLIKVATEGLATDIDSGYTTVGDNLGKKERLEEWGTLVLKSLISTAGKKIVSEPTKYFGVSDAQGALINKVGDSFINLAIVNDDLNLKGIFGRDGLNTLTKAALEAVAEHPELIYEPKDESEDEKKAAQEKGIKGLISDLAKAFSKENPLTDPDIVPKLSRIVLEKTSQNLELIFPELDPKKHLLLTAVSKALEIISAVPEDDDKWTLKFGKNDAIKIIDELIGEIVANPSWLQKASENNEYLSSVLDASLKVLRKKADNRLSLTTAKSIFIVSLKVIALKQEFIEKLNGAQPLVVSAIDEIVTKLFDADNSEKVSWQLLQDDAVRAIFEIGLKELAKVDLSTEVISSEKIEKLGETITQLISSINEGASIDWDEFRNNLKNKLS